MKMRFLVFPAILLATASVMAWQIKGKVTDRAGVAIADATVSVVGDSATLTTTSATGAFSITETKTTGVRPSSAGSSPVQSFALDAGNNSFVLYVPTALRARLEWFDLSGRSLALIKDCDLSQGSNRINPAKFSAPQGVCIMQLSSGGVRMSWKIVLSGAGQHGSSGPSNTVQSVLSKTLAIDPVIIVKKDSYKSRRYYAIDSTKDTLAWVILAATDDDSTYKLPGTSYAAGAVPPNKMVDNASVAKIKYAYGGMLVKYLLGYQAGSCCGAAIFNNVYAPSDATYTCTFGVYCGSADSMGDNCSPPTFPNTYGGGCRPMEFVINDVEVSGVWHMPCRKEEAGWRIVFYQPCKLPLKKGLNSIKFYTKGGADAPDLDRLIVDDGRTY